MGFYGNITNTARTQFQFDLIYPNKTEMVKKQATDGVYIGRYVLIEYDTETHTSSFDRVYINNGIMYTSANFEYGTMLTRNNTEKGMIVYTAEDTQMEAGYPLSKCAFYTITSEHAGSNSPATFKEIVSAGTKVNYTYNYNIDMAKGEEGRGYDSTVWQKTYINGSEKYVMIAELNSVVPTFNLVADAPMMAPITPHFDIESTDIYYKLHWQTPWGFRVAEAKGTDVTSTTNNKAQLPSDTKATYIINSYDKNSGKNTTTTSDEYNAAIYYNAAGFNPEKRSRSTYKDDISVKPTGKSGNEYNLHIGGADNAAVQPDIIEFSFILPSLGNAISDMWDIVYTDKRSRDVAWKDALTPEANEDLGGMTRELTTIAGCINHVHDLMGMIITDRSEATLNEEWYNKKYLYQDGDKYYRIAAEQTYTYPNDATIGTVGDIEYKFVEVPDVAGKLSTIYGCILQVRELMGTELAANTEDRNTVQGSINVLNKLIDLFESKINPGAPVITNQHGQFATSTITTTQMYSAENWANPEANIAEKPKDKAWISYSVDGVKKEIEVIHTFNNDVEDTTTEKDVNNNGDTIITYAPIVDNMGHIVGKNTETTTLPYGYKNIVVGASSDVTGDVTHDNKKILTADNTQDTITFKPSNKWIKMQADNKTVSISHEVHSFTDGNANIEYGLTANKSISDLDDNNTFEVPAFRFDEAGHITGAKTCIVTIPENFDTVAITNSGKDSVDTAEAQDANLIADTLTDTVTFDAGNRWITLVGNAGSDKVSIYHAAAVNQTNTTQTGNEEPDFGATFTIPEVKYDETGHISGIDTHTVKVPQPSLNDFEATSASVITGMKMDDSLGEITIAHGDIGQRLLTGYILGSSDAEVVDSDTVNSAFSKLQVQLNTEVSNRESAVAAEKTRAEAAEGALTTSIDNEQKRAEGIEQGLNSRLAQAEIDIDNLQSQISSNDTDISNLDNKIDKKVEEMTSAIAAETSAREEVIKGLSFNLTCNDNEYISSIEQIDGKINAAKTIFTFPDYSDEWGRITTLENDLKAANKTITDLTAKIEVLESSINSLAERVAKLEPTEPTPDPDAPETETE